MGSRTSRSRCVNVGRILVLAHFQCCFPGGLVGEEDAGVAANHFRVPTVIVCTCGHAAACHRRLNGVTTKPAADDHRERHHPCLRAVRGSPADLSGDTDGSVGVQRGAPPGIRAARSHSGQLRGGTRPLPHRACAGRSIDRLLLALRLLYGTTAADIYQVTGETTAVCRHSARVDVLPHHEHPGTVRPAIVSPATVQPVEKLLATGGR